MPAFYDAEEALDLEDGEDCGGCGECEDCAEVLREDAEAEKADRDYDRLQEERHFKGEDWWLDMYMEDRLSGGMY